MVRLLLYIFLNTFMAASYKYCTYNTTTSSINKTHGCSLSWLKAEPYNKSFLYVKSHDQKYAYCRPTKLGFRRVQVQGIRRQEGVDVSMLYAL
jgi:hypothetical protein